MDEVKWVAVAIRARYHDKGLTYSASKWGHFWRYFSRTWVILYPPMFWNFSGLVGSEINRTNDPLERFNRELNDAFSSPRPNLPVFVSTIERISLQRDTRISDINHGRAARPKVTIYPLPAPVDLDDLPDFEDAGSDSNHASENDSQSCSSHSADDCVSEEIDGRDDSDCSSTSGDLSFECTNDDCERE